MIRGLQIKALFIIKTGESETFVEDLSNEVSLGDIFRTRTLLNLKETYGNIYWLTSTKGFSLLKYDKDIVFDSVTEIEKYIEIIRSENTIVLNLEKSEKIIESLKLVRKDFFGWFVSEHGFLFRSADSVGRNLVELNSMFGNSWGEKLIRSLDQTSMSFCIPELPLKNSSKYQIGLNWKIGSKWTNKSLSENFWKKLEQKLLGKYSISWQLGEKNLDDYLSWISACDLIITHDSLGLHLALGMNKKIVGLFGVTNPLEIDWNENSSYLQFDPAKEYDENSTIFEQIEAEIKKCLTK